MTSHRLAPLALSLSTLVGGALAQGLPQPLTEEGDSVPGFGLVTEIRGTEVNDAGAWGVLVDTDDPFFGSDAGLLDGSGIVHWEGDPVTAVPGTTISGVGSIDLDSSGNWLSVLYLNGAISGTDSGVFLNTTLVLREGDVSTAGGFSSGTIYKEMQRVLVNDSRQILILADVDDPGIPSFFDAALVKATIDGAGNLLGESVVVKEGDVLAGQTEGVFDLGTLQHAFDMNAAGDVLYPVLLSGNSQTNEAVYLNGTLLAQKGSPSPVPGRDWAGIGTGQRFSLGAAGDYAFTALLDNTDSKNQIIVRNGAKFRQEGDGLAAIGPYTLTSFGSAPVDLDGAGNLLWYGTWNDPNEEADSGLFLNDTLLVQEGVTSIGGTVVDSISGVRGGFAISDNGRWVVFEAFLEGGQNGAFLIDLQGCGLPTTYCTAKPTSIPGCAPVFTVSGAPSATAGNGFDVSYGPVPGANVGLQIYATGGPAAAPLANPFGFLCLDTSGLFRLPPGPSGGSTGACDGVYAVDFNSYFATQTDDPSLVAGASVDPQVWYRDPPSPGTANLSNAIRFTMCP